MKKCIGFSAIVLGLAILPLFAQTSADDPRLKRALERFPGADADKDGVLTMAEARAFRNNNARRRARDGEKTGEGPSSPEVINLYEAHEFDGMNYRLLKPIDLAENPDKKYPMILSLHGAGGTGRDNLRNLRAWNVTMAQEDLRRRHPCFVVVPQSVGPWQTQGVRPDYTDEKFEEMTADWQEVIKPRLRYLQNPESGDLDRVFKLLDALAEEFPIDTDRVYVLGHSMGGFGTWTAVTAEPGRFAAAITSAGWVGPWVDVSRIKDLPMWSFQGARDKTSQVSLGNATFERMNQLGHNLKFTEMANRGHNVGDAAFTYTGDDPVEGGVTRYASDKCDQTADVWDWLFRQKRARENPYSPTAAESLTPTEAPVARQTARETESLPLAATVSTSYLIHHPQFGAGRILKNAPMGGWRAISDSRMVRESGWETHRRNP